MSSILSGRAKHFTITLARQNKHASARTHTYTHTRARTHARTHTHTHTHTHQQVHVIHSPEYFIRFPSINKWDTSPTVFAKWPKNQGTTNFSRPEEKRHSTGSQQNKDVSSNQSPISIIVPNGRTKLFIYLRNKNSLSIWNYYRHVYVITQTRKLQETIMS